MKKLILIFIPLLAFSKPKLKDCQEALSKCLASESILHDTIYLHVPKTSRKDVKIAKFNAKTERNESNNKNKYKAEVSLKKEETKQLKITHRSERSNEKQKTKRNFVFQLGSSIKKFINSLTIGQILWAKILGATGGASALFTMLLGYVKKGSPFAYIFGLFRGNQEEKD